MAGGLSKAEPLVCLTDKRQAPHDRHRRIFLHHLGHMAEALSERQARSIRSGLATIGHLHTLGGTQKLTREWRSKRRSEEDQMRKLRYLREDFTCLGLSRFGRRLGVLGAHCKSR